MSYEYDSSFFDFVNASSGKSARLFLRRFIEWTLGNKLPRSVLDVGCGRGAWLAEWLTYTGVDARGVDGQYVDSRSLVIPEDRFVALDISQPIDLGERFDLVQCLEVAEHIPAERADVLIDNLIRHSDLILFSAATPGQGGEFHVNEQPLEYWRQKFGERGYSAFDAVRPAVKGLLDIEPWYRFNALMFASMDGAQRMSPAALAMHVPDDVEVRVVASLMWRLRCKGLSYLPDDTITGIARTKHRLANSWHRLTIRR